jgi:hypothetical protein
MSLEHLLRDEKEALDFLLREEFEMSFTESDIWEYGYGPSGHPDDGAEQEILEQAWRDLQAVPSYVEQQARAWAAELGLEVQV